MLRIVRTKWSIPVVVLALLLFGALVPRAATGANPYQDLFRQLLQRSAADEEVVATVNGSPIKRGAVRSLALLLKTNLPELKEDEARKSAVRRIAQDQLAYEEARRRGLVVSREEAERYANEQRAQIEKGPAYGRAMIADHMQALGLSEDQYWAMQVDNYAILMSRGRLHIEVEKELPPTATREEREAHWQQYLDSLMARAKIEYKDPTLR